MLLNTSVCCYLLHPFASAKLYLYEVVHLTLLNSQLQIKVNQLNYLITIRTSQKRRPLKSENKIKPEPTIANQSYKHTCTIKHTSTTIKSLVHSSNLVVILFSIISPKHPLIHSILVSTLCFQNLQSCVCPPMLPSQFCFVPPIILRGISCKLFKSIGLEFWSSDLYL